MKIPRLFKLVGEDKMKHNGWIIIWLAFIFAMGMEAQQQLTLEQAKTKSKQLQTG
ncbi:MAG: hypothetical protein Q8K98_12540 [Bacteroidota bacterium]|nr:hypothetical protein [Bacteroidota bacterium]